MPAKAALKKSFKQNATGFCSHPITIILEVAVCYLRLCQKWMNVETHVNMDHVSCTSPTNLQAQNPLETQGF